MRPSASRQLRPLISLQRLSLRHLQAGVVEFVAADEIDHRRLLQSLSGQNRHMGADETQHARADFSP